MALSNRRIAGATLIIMAGFVASGVLGLLRTILFSTTFGADQVLDSFYAAQRLPETLFVLVAGGALGSAFIPIYARFNEKGDADAADRLARSVLTAVFAIATVSAILMAIAAPLFVPTLLEPGATPAAQALTTDLTRILLATVAIFGVSGTCMAILNTRGVYSLPALALVMNNLGQIAGALLIAPLFPPDQAAFGLAWGAVLGSLLHLLVQLPAIPRRLLRPLLAFDTPGVRDVLVRMLPRIFGSAVVQINFIVNVSLTSGMIAGSRTLLVTAWSLMFFALGVIGQSVGSAVFPTLAALAARGDVAGFRDRLNRAIGRVLLLALPAVLGIFFLGEWGIGLLFERGAWTSASTQGTAWALALFAIGIPGHALLEVLARAFFALDDTWTPVVVGIAAMVANIVLSLVLIGVIGDPTSLARGAFGGLAVANSVTTLVEAGVLWWLLGRRVTVQARAVAG